MLNDIEYVLLDEKQIDEVTSKLAVAGYSRGAYSFDVPSCLTADMAITESPEHTGRAIPPQVPTRIKVFTPTAASSSTAIADEGPPMPVEHTVTVSPRSVPFHILYSRLVLT